MSLDNITLLLSLDNCVYGVLTKALDCHPFNIIKRMTFDYTYFYGIKTMKVFAMSKDIEDIISETSNGASFKPCFIQDNKPTNIITTKHDNNQIQSVYIDIFKITEDTHNILSGNLDYEFIEFCNDFIDDYEKNNINDKIFESLEDHDMILQCNRLLNDNEGQLTNLL